MTEKTIIPELPPNMVFRPRLQKIFEEPFKKRRILYISAYMGWGKTTAVAEWLIQYKHKAVWFCLEERKKQKQDIFHSLLNEMNEKSGEKLIVIDHYDLLDKEELGYMNLMLMKSTRRFVIISRAELPESLSIYVGLSVHLIGIDQLKFTESETVEYFETWNISLSDQEVSQLTVRQRGCALSYRYTACLMQASGETYTKNIRLKVLECLYRYLDAELLDKLDQTEREVLLKIGCFDSVTADQADLFLGSSGNFKILDDFRRRGFFLTFFLPDVYVLDPFFKEYLTYVRKKSIPTEESNAIYKLAGSYFEKNNDISQALECYGNAKDYESIMRILIRLSTSESGQADLWKNRKYYYDLPEERVKEEPALCCGMAMLGILSFHLEEADAWREYLEDRLKGLPEGDKKTEIGNKLAYLAMAMSGSGSTNDLLNIFLYGDVGIGAADVAAAECCYQQDKIQEAFVQIAGAISLIEQKGSILILFAAMTVQMRIMMLLGETATAKSILNRMGDKIREANADFLYPHLEAVCVFAALYQNDYERIDYWLKNEAPDENAAFCALDIFGYNVKLRAYILQEKYYPAIGLAEKLRPIYTAFHKNIDLAQLDMLLAIVYHRLGQKEKAEDYLCQALEKGEKYGYIRLFADQGESLYKMLKNMGERCSISKNYLKRVKEAAKKVAVMYPSYMILPSKQDRLSASETEVLNLIAQGKANPEIADYLSISLNTVKFHVKNIYSKLGVNNRFQAVHTAKLKGLIP
ncbi:LuxR C-terminal-related transcriptional regulator [Aminipila luticellarii]|uniref:HTH luxR-type domain-containing protein n=1 Tax=Aminipila luticellarii TaxID=2507160 RepID=A0A410PWG4_9FIRM|nr:LuxR C-terminal-related transcriptional regulator [Aminipila luticellarii]QAT43240.1 hypothetical protein EQM06_08405 [Aminipila luticellarii]